MVTIRWVYRGPWWKRQFYKWVIVEMSGHSNMHRFKTKQFNVAIQSYSNGLFNYMFECKRQVPRKKYKTIIFV